MAPTPGAPCFVPRPPTPSLPVGKGVQIGDDGSTMGHGLEEWDQEPGAAQRLGQRHGPRAGRQERGDEGKLASPWKPSWERRLLPAARAWPSPPAPILDPVAHIKVGTRPLARSLNGPGHGSWLLEAADGQMVIAPRVLRDGLRVSTTPAHNQSWCSGLPASHSCIHSCPGTDGSAGVGERGLWGLL